MPRIPLANLAEAVGSYGLDEMVKFDGPVYIMTVDGEVNIVFNVFDPGNDGFSYEELKRHVQNQKIPNIWK